MQSGRTDYGPLMTCCVYAGFPFRHSWEALHHCTLKCQVGWGLLWASFTTKCAPIRAHFHLERKIYCHQWLWGKIFTPGVSEQKLFILLNNIPDTKTALSPDCKEFLYQGSVSCAHLNRKLDNSISAFLLCRHSFGSLLLWLSCRWKLSKMSQK